MLKQTVSDSATFVSKIPPQKTHTGDKAAALDEADAGSTYWGAAVREGGHADGHAHLVRGGQRGRGGAPFIRLLSLEEVTPGALDAAAESVTG